MRACLRRLWKRFFSIEVVLIFKFWKIANLFRHYSASVIDDIILNQTQARQEKLRNIQLILVILALKIAQLLYLLVRPVENDFARLLHYDVMYFYGCPQELNLLHIEFGLQIGYFLYGMYWFDYGNLGRPLWIVRRIIYGPPLGFFFERQLPLPQSQASPSVRVRKYTFWYINTAQVLITCGLGFILLFYYVKTSLYIWENVPYFTRSLLGLVSLALLQLQALWTHFFLASFAVINIVESGLLFGLTFISFFRLSRLPLFLTVIPRGSYVSLINLDYFYLYHNQTFTFIVQISAIFGRQLFVFILLNFPLNTFLVMGILQGLFPPVTSLIFSYVILVQYFGIFGFHLLSSMYSCRLHACSKQLTPLYVRGNRARLPFRARLRMSHYIGKFETTRKYGIHYGNIGLINFQSFGKFIILYTEILMYWHSFNVKVF